MPAQNAVMGNEPSLMGGVAAMPQAAADDTQLKELRDAAKFAKSSAYKDIKAHLERRMDFYRTYLPDGRAIGAQEPDQNLANMWVVANCLIGEFSSVLSVYDNAAEMLKEAQGNVTP